MSKISPLQAPEHYLGEIMPWSIKATTVQYQYATNEEGGCWNMACTLLDQNGINLYTRPHGG